MKGYSCYYEYSIGDEEFKKSPSSVCWAGLSNIIKDSFLPEYLKKNTISLKIMIPEDAKYIEYSQLICDVINKITPCKFKKNIVHYEVFQKNYYKNLFLLNFIRQLWYDDDSMLYYSSGSRFKCFDSKILFEFIKENENKIKDKIVLLTTANKEASSEDSRVTYSIGHSNHNRKSSLKIRDSKFFEQKDIISLNSFLTG